MPKKSNLPLLLGLGAGAVVLVVGAIVAGVLLVNNNDGGDAASTTSTTPTTTSPTTTEPTTTETSTALDQRIPRGFVLDQNIPMGTCYDIESAAFDLADAHVVDCASPHQMEFVSTFVLNNAYTDQQDPRVMADILTCWRTVVEPQVSHDTKLYNDSLVVSWYPSANQIGRGETTAYCVLVGDGEGVQLIGSLVAGTYQGAQ